MTRAEMLAEVVRRREALKAPTADASATELLTLLDALEFRLIDGDVPQDDWEQFELHWAAHLAELMSSIRYRSAHVMLAFEDIEAEDPHHFDDDEDVKKLLRWWREEGGREQFLGNITLEERQKLEAMAREWRTKRGE